MRQAVNWLLASRSPAAAIGRTPSRAEPGGWCFEYNNDFYPDVDDTCMVLMALRTQFDDAAGRRDAAAGVPPGRRRRAGRPVARRRP